MNLAGTRFLLANKGSGYVRQYDLTTPFDIRASNHFSTDDFDLTTVTSGYSGIFSSHNGEHIYGLKSSGRVYQWDLSSPFDVSTASYIQYKSLPHTSYNYLYNPFKMSPDGDFERHGLREPIKRLPSRTIPHHFGTIWAVSYTHLTLPTIVSV